MNVKAEKMRRGLYRIIGLVCSGGCGGEVHIERCSADGVPVSKHPMFRWETFCTKCRACDNNGWPTLAEALANSEEYFGEKVES